VLRIRISITRVGVIGAVEQGGDRALLGGAHRLDRAQAVDEQPVALVRRHPAGAGVGLVDEALLLQRCHVVAHGGRRDIEPVPLDQRPRADRLLGGDVVLDDRAQDGELAVLDHVASFSARLARPALLCTALALCVHECQDY
jgi:hypothetical protein